MVTLNPAYSWDCPECGAENFERGIVPEMSPEELAATKAEMGIEPWDEGSLMMMPTQVTCRGCGVKFATLHYHEA
jgi:hypothetical protein